MFFVLREGNEVISHIVIVVGVGESRIINVIIIIIVVVVVVVVVIVVSRGEIRQEWLHRKESIS